MQAPLLAVVGPGGRTGAARQSRDGHQPARNIVSLDIPSLYNNQNTPSPHPTSNKPLSAAMSQLWTSPTSPTTETRPRVDSRARSPARRFAQIIKLKPEHVDKYKEVHAAVWPEVLKQIKDCNIQDCAFSDKPLPKGKADHYHRQHLPRPGDGHPVCQFQVRRVRLRRGHGAHAGEPQGSRVVEDDGQHARIAGAGGQGQRVGRAVVVEAGRRGLLHALNPFEMSKLDQERFEVPFLNPTHVHEDESLP